MGYRVEEVQPTPNPNAMKFVLDRPIVQQPMSFFNAGAAKDHPLATRLFAIPGVSSLLFLGDFVTINKSSETRWADIKDRAKKILAAEA